MNGRLDEWEVVVPIRTVGSVGALPCVSVKNIAPGFDWDTGRFFINPVEELEILDDPRRKSVLDKYDELGHVQLENRRLKAENKKLHQQLEELVKAQ